MKQDKRTAVGAHHSELGVQEEPLLANNKKGGKKTGK